MAAALGRRLSHPKRIGWADYLCVGSAIGLLGIWVLPDTIALRHLLLITGFLGASRVIAMSSFFKGRSLQELLPLILLSLLFVWVVIHYFFFSLNPTLEAQEIRSLWLRSLLCAVIALGLRISLANHPVLQPYFFAALWIVPIINIAAYGYLSIEAGNLLRPNDFVWAFVFKKIEAAFYGVLAVSIACANLFYWSNKAANPNSIRAMIIWGIAIVIAVLSALLANTKNGIAGTLGLCALLALIITARLLLIRQRSTHSKNSLWLGFIIVAFIALLWQAHSRFASEGWKTLAEDIQISAQVDSHNFWRMSAVHWDKLTTEPFPQNSTGAKVAGNTYERVAWAVMGLRLINHYPYGYGSVNRSYKGMLDAAGVQHQLESQTHSGWIDFGLAYGVPGLSIFALIFISVIWFAIRNYSQLSLIGLWLVFGLVPFGLVAEITYKHNFETLIFFVALACAFVIKPNQYNTR